MNADKYPGMHQGTAVPAFEPGTADTEPVRVLHVDDDASHRKLTRTFLEREGGGITAETAPDARAGRKRLAEGGIKCIVSDYEMSGTDGLAFLEAVREDHPEILFILFMGKRGDRKRGDLDGRHRLPPEGRSRTVPRARKPGRERRRTLPGPPRAGRELPPVREITGVPLR